MGRIRRNNARTRYRMQPELGPRILTEWWQIYSQLKVPSALIFTTLRIKAEFWCSMRDRQSIIRYRFLRSATRSQKILSHRPLTAQRLIRCRRRVASPSHRKS